jgi:hypothetical protein
MTSEYTNNLTDDENDIVKELSQECFGNEEEMTEEEIEAWNMQADREIFAAIDEVYAQSEV